MKPGMNKIGKRMKNSFLDKIYKWSMSHKRYVFIVLILSFLFILYTEQIKTLIILLVFGLVATFTTTYKRFIRLPPVLEFITLTTVLTTIFYGPITGIIYTIIVNITSEIASGHPDEMILTYIPSRTTTVLFTHFAYTLGLITNIVWLGIWSSVVFNAVQQPLYMSLVDVEKRLKSLYFVLLNIPLNILIFKLFGSLLFALMTAIV
ncbi:hypothetical protein CMO88_04570 [Candidatus Woesearchaeota archaeon]|nr:hypothetical protein [Candidatus Woesearchaeota archaeon]